MNTIKEITLLNKAIDEVIRVENLVSFENFNVNRFKEEINDISIMRSHLVTSDNKIIIY